MAGLAVRAPITFLVMYFSGFSAKEKLFFALAWTPKASLTAYTYHMRIEHITQRQRLPGLTYSLEPLSASLALSSSTFPALGLSSPYLLHGPLQLSALLLSPT